MKHKLLSQLFMASKIAVKGVLLQCFFLNLLWATTINAQEVKSVYDVKITIKSQSDRLEDIFKDIETQTNFVFSYLKEDIGNATRINSLQLTKKTSVAELLMEVSRNYNLMFKQVNNVINVIPGNTKIPQESVEVIIQTRNITGRITSQEDGEGLPGVNVIEKGTRNGTVTNVEGTYSLSVAHGATLVFSSVGYSSEEIEIGNRSVIDWVMITDIRQLDELVVVGYGTAKKANLTGAVGLANAERFENRPIASVGHGLQGVIPNLNITFRNGDPTTPTTFNIRGYESINGGSPLILVDGVPMDLDRINPSDIASVNVLKDASASAVYGARAAFGVILVETKKGKEGKMNIQFGHEKSWSKPIIHVDPVQDPYEAVTIWNDVYQKNIGTNRYAQFVIDGTKRYSENPTLENEWGVRNGSLIYYGSNNYIDQVVADFAPQDKYNLNFSGATKNASYYASFGYLDKYGYIKHKDRNLRYQRYNILLKTDIKVNDWLSLDPKIVANIEMNNKPHEYGAYGYLNGIARVDPIYPIQFPDLPYYLEPGDRGQYEQYIGAYIDNSRLMPYLMKGGRDTFTKNDTWLSQGATITPFKGFKIRNEFSYQYFTNFDQEVESKVEMVKTNLLDMQWVYGGSAADYISNRSNYNQYYVFNSYAEYTLDKSADHYLKVMAGFNQEWGRNTFMSARAETLASPNIVDLSATTGPKTNSGGKSHVSLRGAFYRLNYIYKDKYLVEFNGRYDGTSRFPKESRMAFFPSVSGGWRISNENIMGGTSGWLDNLMIRASYGTLGNQLLGSNYYAYIPSMGMGQVPYIMANGTIPYVSPAGLVSADLTWETVSTKNIGFDIAVLKDRLNLSADAYHRDTKNMLMKKSYPAVLGAPAPNANAADLRTVGWEVNLIWRDKIGKDLSYRINLALSDNQTKITKYDNPTGAITDYYVGKKIGEIWGFKTVGIFQSEEEVDAAADQSLLGSPWLPGDIQYADLNNDGKITRGNNTLGDPGDQIIIGNSSARYSFGINTDLTYKNWDLDLFFQGLFRDYFPARTTHADFWPWMADMLEKWWVTESWSEENPDAYWPAPRPFRVVGTARNYNPQTRFLQNASYIRLKNVTLSYSLPDNLINKTKGISKIQFYLSGMNLWEHTKMQKPLDPEQIYTLLQEYYMQRMFTLGINVTL